MGLALAALVGAALLTRTGAGPEPLVVYCAHDQEFSEQVLKDFEAKTGIRVAVRYDAEATKSLGLAQLLQREKNAPRCDVFWNNQLLTTLELERDGLLEPYRGAGWSRMPPEHRSPDGHWVGFAARLRILVTHADASPDAARALDGPDAADVPDSFFPQTAVAVPLYGTTLTHYALLWKEWGPERLKAWHAEVRRRGLREVRGNGPAMRLVAEGTCLAGWTDTDDYFVAKDGGARVAMSPVRVGGGTICIPNTAAIIRGTPRRAAAEALVDFLTSAETELALARSPSRQIPLGPVDAAQLPEEVRPLREWSHDGCDLRPLAVPHRECLEWLKSLYAR